MHICILHIYACQCIYVHSANCMVGSVEPCRHPTLLGFSHIDCKLWDADFVLMSGLLSFMFITLNNLVAFMFFFLYFQTQTCIICFFPFFLPFNLIYGEGNARTILVCVTIKYFMFYRHVRTNPMYIHTQIQVCKVDIDSDNDKELMMLFPNTSCLYIVLKMGSTRDSAAEQQKIKVFTPPQIINLFIFFLLCISLCSFVVCLQSASVLLK